MCLYFDQGLLSINALIKACCVHALIRACCEYMPRAGLAVCKCSDLDSLCVNALIRASCM